jgi:hypothetical protein
MAVSQDILRVKYRDLPDEKLLRLAAEDAARLRPEALILLQEELASRGLAEQVEESIKVQLRKLGKDEIEEYCVLVRTQPCPRCHSSLHPLNATVVSRVASFIVVTTWKEQFAIACPTCLDKLSQEAVQSSLLLGWWAIPWGVIRTIQAVNFNRKKAKANHLPYPNDSLKAFVVSRVASIDAANKTPFGLQAYLISLLIEINRMPIQAPSIITQ